MSQQLARRDETLGIALDDTMELGRILAASGFFADSRDAAQAVVKVLAGRELGIGAIASMTGINVIKGRVTLSANLIAACVKRHPRYDFRVKDMSNDGCTIEFFQDGESVGETTFTMADARQAGLGGDNWKRYPKNMCFARAISNGAKFFTPDVFGGAVYTPEEMGAKVDEEGSVVEIEPTETRVKDNRIENEQGPAVEIGEPKPPKKATTKQLQKLAVLASNYGWSDEERRERAGVASFRDLTFDAASTLIEAWEADETSGDVVNREGAATPEDAADGSGGVASPPATEQPSDPTADVDEPASSEHLTRLSEAYGGASKALLAARREFGAEIQSVSALTKAQATKLMESKLG